MLQGPVSSHQDLNVAGVSCGTKETGCLKACCSCHYVLCLTSALSAVQFQEVRITLNAIQGVLCLSHLLYIADWFVLRLSFSLFNIQSVQQQLLHLKVLVRMLLAPLSASAATE